MQSCVHSFFFAKPTGPPSPEGGQWATKHFIGMGKTIALAFLRMRFAAGLCPPRLLNLGKIRGRILAAEI